jgi:hypothetical protein
MSLVTSVLVILLLLYWLLGLLPDWLARSSSLRALPRVGVELSEAVFCPTREDHS